MDIILVSKGQEAEVAKILVGHIEEIPEDWGCPECGSQNITVEAIKGVSYDIPITGLWASETHGHRAYLDWSKVNKGETRGINTTVFRGLRCQNCNWKQQTNGDTEVLRRK